MMGMYLVLALIRRGQLGIGDVKFGGVIGLFLGWLGWGEALLGMLAAFILSAVVGSGHDVVLKLAPSTCSRSAPHGRRCRRRRRCRLQLSRDLRKDMTRKIITALITVGLVTLFGCAPTGGTMQVPARTVSASKPKPKPPAPNCTPGYKPCLPPKPSYTCGDINGHVLVTGNDPYALDKDHDGVGCDW